jgi:hypothetical protein
MLPGLDACAGSTRIEHSLDFTERDAACRCQGLARQRSPLRLPRY